MWLDCDYSRSQIQQALRVDSPIGSDVKYQGIFPDEWPVEFADGADALPVVILEEVYVSCVDTRVA
jgi:hypothetical protein